MSKLDTRTDSKGRSQPANRRAARLGEIKTESGYRREEARYKRLREQKPVVVRQPITDAVPTDDVDALQALLLTLRGNPRHIAGIPLDRRVSMARTCLAWLNLTPDDLRAP